MILSSSPAMYRIHKRQGTGEVALLPLLGLWLNCHTVMLYGWATGAFFPLFTTFAFGEVMAIIYITVFLRWTMKRTYVLKATGMSFIVVALTAIYTILGMTGATGQTRTQVGLITGYMMAMGCVLLYMAPIETIVRVAENALGCIDSHPVYAWQERCPIRFGSSTDSSWVIDTFIFILSIVCAAFALFQVVLYFVFRPTHQSAGVAHAETRPIHTIQVSDEGILPKERRHCGIVSAVPRLRRHAVSIASLRRH